MSLYQLLVDGLATSFAPEVGVVRRDGKYLKDDRGVWFGRGLTMFLLYARYLRGEDVRPQLRWSRSAGANYLRLFGPVPTPPWDPEWGPYNRPDPSLFNHLSDFVLLAGAEGLRIEFVPVCGPWSMYEAQSLLRASYNQLAGKWNAFSEATNEPGQVGTFHLNLHQLIDNVDRKGVLSSTGVAWWLKDADCQQLLGIPKMTSVADIHWLDYGTGHFNDTSYAGTVNARYPRTSKAARDWRDGDVEVQMPGSGRPTWLDEDARVDDTDTYPGIEDHVCHNAIGCIFSGAQLIHFNAGKFGLIPTPGGLEDTVIKETAKLWAFIPPEAQTGTYSRPGPGGTGDYPLEWHDLDSSTVNHAYCSWMGDVGYCVNCLPPKGWKAVPRSGYRIIAEGPRPWILKVGR